MAQGGRWAEAASMPVSLKASLRAGFEPAREDPIGFQVQRLNHSAITAYKRATQPIIN